MMKLNEKMCTLLKKSSNLFSPALKISISSHNRLVKNYSSNAETNTTVTAADNGNIIQIKDFQSEEKIVTEKYGAITIISLNRPAEKNAITKEMATKLTEAIETFENDNTANVGILHGVGGNFSVGLDLDELRDDVKNPERFVEDDGFAGPTQRIIKKPMICGVSGACQSAGLELALMCDLRIVETTALLGFNMRKYGVPIMDSGTTRLPAMIGISRALDIILTGREVTAKEAFEIGLANRLVAPGSALGQAVNLAVCLAKYPQASLNHDRFSVYTSLYGAKALEQMSQNEVMGFSKAILADMAHGLDKENDGQQFIQSFMPNWEKEEYNREVERERKKKTKKE